MSQFEFRLQTLLRLREHARDERRAQLADALRVDAELQRRQQELETDLTGARDSQRIRPGVVDIDRLLSAQRYELLLQAHLAGVVQQRAHVAKEIDARRQVLVEADRDVRVLEKLRETQHQRWNADQQRLDQRRFDEVAGIGHWRQKARSE